MSVTSIRPSSTPALQGGGSAQPDSAASSAEQTSAATATSDASPASQTSQTSSSAPADAGAPPSTTQVPPGSSAPPPDDAATRALAARIAAALPPEEPAAPEGLALDHERSAVLDPAEVPPGQVRDVTSNDVADPVPLIPLEPDGLVGPVGARERTADATTVHVTLNRMESIYPGMVEDGALSHLGEPEYATLRPGDTVRVFVWNDNKTGDPLSTGVRLADGRQLDEVFEDARVLQADFSWQPPLGSDGGDVGPGARLDDGTGLYGVTLEGEQFGGYVLELTVRDDVEPGTTVGFQHVATPGRDLAPGDVRALDFQAADAAWRSAKDAGLTEDPVSTHEQSTAYGGFHGTLPLTDGRQLLAAPGSTAYDGWLDPKTTPPEVLADARQAAYLVPIRLDVEGDGPREVALRTFGDWGSAAGNIDAYVMRDGERVALPPSPLGQDGVQWVQLEPGDELFVTFGGSSATAAFLDVREP